MSGHKLKLAPRDGDKGGMEALAASEHEGMIGNNLWQCTAAAGSSGQ